MFVLILPGNAGRPLPADPGGDCSAGLPEPPTNPNPDPAFFFPPFDTGLSDVGGVCDRSERCRLEVLYSGEPKGACSSAGVEFAEKGTGGGVRGWEMFGIVVVVVVVVVVGVGVVGVREGRGV